MIVGGALPVILFSLFRTEIALIALVFWVPLALVVSLISAIRIGQNLLQLQ